MFNEFDTNETSTKKSNGTNPFDLSPADPFGISSAENFVDNPFVIQTNVDKSAAVRPRSGKEALSSSNWLAYQHSMDEANLDSNEELAVVAQNANNPFSMLDTQTTSTNNSSDNVPAQNFNMDFLFDSNSANPFANDPFGLNANSSNENSQSQTNTTAANSGFDNQFSDWFTQSQTNSAQNPSKEPTFSQNVISQEKTTKSDEDSDDDDAKMVVKIGEKKSTTTAMAVPLLLPPPPTSKHYKEASDDASSSSSETENDDDDDDPLAIFRSKSIKTKSNETQNRNLITDWEENESTVNRESQEKTRATSPPLDYYLHEPDYDDSAPLEAYHNDINELQLQQLNGWLLQIRVPLRQKDLYKSTFQRFSEQRNWQECYVRIFFDEKKLRFYLPQTIEQSFAEIELQTWYQCTKFNLQQYDQYSKIHTFKIFEANYREIPQVRIDRLVTLPEKLLRRFTRPNKAQQVLLDHANCVQQEIVKFGQLNYAYLKQFSIILEDLFWSMPVARSRLQKHLKEEITVKILDEYYAHIDKYRHICKHKSRTRLFILAFLNGQEPVVEIGMNDWFRHGKEVNKRNEIIINKTLQEYWIKPEQVELASIIDANEYENTHLLKLIPPDSQKIEIMRFRTRPKQNIELPLHAYCFMSVIDRQVNIRLEVTVSNAFNISLFSKASSMATNDKTANIRDDNSDEQCPCQDIQIRFPIPDPWVYMFRVEKRFRYGAIHSVRQKAGKIKGLDRFMAAHRNDGLTPFMAASAGVAKYEQAFRAIVWRIDQLPKRDQGAYKTHLFECKFAVPLHDPIPDKYEPIADVEYTMAQAFVSHCQIRSVAAPQSDETPEKWIRPKSHFTYTLDIEYAFKEEEKKEFAPIEIDMKEQTMSQSETENNSQSDDSD